MIFWTMRQKMFSSRFLAMIVLFWVIANRRKNMDHCYCIFLKMFKAVALAHLMG